MRKVFSKGIHGYKAVSYSRARKLRQGHNDDVLLVEGESASKAYYGR